MLTLSKISFMFLLPSFFRFFRDMKLRLKNRPGKTLMQNSVSIIRSSLVECAPGICTAVSAPCSWLHLFLQRGLDSPQFRIEHAVSAPVRAHEREPLNPHADRRDPDPRRVL